MSTPLTTYYEMILPEYVDASDVKDLNDNFELIDTTMHNLATGKKDKQTAVTDPTADGNSFSFIDSFAQDEDGDATVTKKTVPEMTAASAGEAGEKGLVPAPAAGDNTKFLRGDKTWATPPDTTYSDFTGAGSSSAGAHGLVPAPAAGDNTKFLRGDKTWAVPTNTTYESKTAASGGTDLSLCTTGEKYTWNNKLSSHQTIKIDGITGATITRFGTCSTAAGTAAKTVSIGNGTFSLEAGAIIAVKFSNANTASTPTLNVNSKGAKNIFVNGSQITTSAANYGLLKGTVIFVYDGTQWHLIGNYYDSGNTTYSDFTGASGSSAGAHGLVPAPAAGDNTKFLRGDKTWATPTNTTYESKAAASGGTAVSLCTTGEKYNWNNKLSSHQSLDGCLKTTGNMSASGVFSFTNTTDSSSTSTGAMKLSGGLGVAKNIYGNKVYNAVWNDYAECRETIYDIQPGRVVRESVMGKMVLADRRRMRGCKIVSDTYGTCMGETETAKTPIGVAGRVLAYPTRDRNKYRLGAPVCSGPHGTVDVMSRLEAILFPECIIGTVSEIPLYEEWCAGTEENPTKIKVDGRIWIYVR